MEQHTPTVVFVDVDDTLIRTIGIKRIPIPAAIAWVRQQKEAGAELYCWSSGGAAYAQEVAASLGLKECFTAFLPKPQTMLDDQPPAEWRYLQVIHPSECANETGTPQSNRESE